MPTQLCCCPSMWLTGGSIGLEVGLLRRGGEFAVVETVPDTSPVNECGDSRESTGDIVTELSGSAPAAFTPFALAPPEPPPLPPPALTPGPSTPEGFFLLFAFKSFNSLAPPPTPPTFAPPPARLLFFPCGPGRMPIRPAPLVPHITEEFAPPPMRLGPLCGLCTTLYWSSKRTMS